jgi:hypothetical protein
MTLRLLLVLALYLPSTLQQLVSAGRWHVVRGDFGRWHVQTRRDAFSGHLECRAFAGGARYERRAVVFHLPSSLDTSDAAYRIDWGPVFWSRDDAPALAHLGFALHNDDDLRNPSGGLVRVPVGRLLAARLVSIEVKRGRDPFLFKINGLAAALEAARKAGCGAGFEPDAAAAAAM